MRGDTSHSDPDEELIPTAIVIKNIPFAVKKEQLVQLMTDLNLPLPYAFNYHFDNGVFRGLAFANFTTAEETAAVIEVMNHFELQGRKLRVEYKKMLPLQERERIEREKRERRGQLEEQHRPMTTPQLHSQPSMSSIASGIPNSPSPVSTRGSKPGMHSCFHLKLTFD
jgi:RNA recognition motif-containing protein